MSADLSHAKLTALLATTFAALPEHRRGKHCVYTLADAAWAAFTVFFTQARSFLARWRDARRPNGRANARKLWGEHQTPSDPQTRNLLDPLAPTHFYTPFDIILQRLKAGGYLQAYRAFANNLLVGLDGVHYFASTTIHCPQCSTSRHGDQIHYSHAALLPVLVAPGNPQVISLEPEFITPQDGSAKQDCEQQAIKRWIVRNAARFAPYPVTILADDLHCKQPLCALLREHHLNFIMTCKPDSHPTLYEEVELLEKIGAVSHVTLRHWNGSFYEQWQCRFVNQVPLREGSAALQINFCEVTITHPHTQELIYHNGFGTNHTITADTVKPIIQAGRARWKTENENHNTLKNHGYHLEHNYGHGQQHLATVLIVLNVLAFLLHTVMDLTSEKYRQLRQELGARMTFFDDLRTLMRYYQFASWDDLLDFMLRGLGLSPGRPP
jgi:hypothetical protein